MTLCKKHLFIGLAFFAVAFLMSCEDYLTKTIEFEEVGFAPKLVINAKILGGQDSVFISASKNTNYADIQQEIYTFIDGVSLNLQVSDDKTYTAVPYNDPNFVYNYLVIIDEIDLSNRTFILEGTHPDYDDVRSEIFLAKKSSYISHTFEKDAVVKTFFGYPEPFDRINFKVQDEPGVSNYYAFSITTEPGIDTFFFEYGGEIDTFINENNGFKFTTDSDDPNAVVPGDFNSTVLFSDKNFDGQEYDFEILFQPFSQNYEDRLRIEYRNITESDFFFLQSFAIYQSAQDFGIFSEPVTLYSNVENGLGVFSAEDKDLIKVN